MSPQIFLFLILVLTVSTGCSARPDNVTIPTETMWMVTATLRPALPLPATETPIPSQVTSTVTPVEGTTATQLNVRAEPSTAGNVLGILPANSQVQITGKDPAGNWWQILYPQGVDGKGWVTAQYVTTANGTAIPVIGDGNGEDPNSGNTAIVQQQINVRSGPGTGFNSLGTLNPKDVVRLSGKDANSTWLQIEYPNAPDGKGWLNAAFVQAQGVENLPIVTEAGEAVGTGTPTGIPPTPTATVIPAWDDQDSQEHPIASVIFEPLGTQTLIYNGDISTPQGDPEDWIQFTPYMDTVYASLDCQGNTNLQTSLLENNQSTTLVLTCGDKLKPVAVKAGETYTIHLQLTQSPGGLQYATYTVTIRMRE